jgi:DNA-binding transcriptional LysR family regulator
MKTELINEFMVFSHYLNFTTAANHLHISQPNLSKHIIEIEHDVGVSLIKRGKTLQLTAAGAAFLEDCIQIHHAYKEAVSRARSIAEQSVEEIVIQTPYVLDAMGEAVYRTIALFKEKAHFTKIHLYNNSGMKSLESLADGKIDIALTIDCAPAKRVVERAEKRGFIFVPIIEEPLRIWLSKDHPLHALDAVRLDDLQGIPINMTAVRSFDPMRFAIIDLFKQNGLKPTLLSHPFETLDEFFMNTGDKRAIFLLSPMVTKNPLIQFTADMDCIDLDDERARITSYLALREDYRKHSIDVFIETLEEAVANEVRHHGDCRYLEEILEPRGRNGATASERPKTEQPEAAADNTENADCAPS